MQQEIERKFLVRDESWRERAGEGIPCIQGYLCSGPPGVSVRVRMLGGQGFLTIKGALQGISRPEFEYPIPAGEACCMIDHLCGDRRIEKMRYTLEVDGMTWEIDRFGGRNQGLIVAEIELESEDQSFTRPAWAGEEVTLDFRYTNSALAAHPFSEWADSSIEASTFP